LVQEEIRWNTTDGTSSKCEDEEICASDGKENNGKRNKSQSKAEFDERVKKKDLSKIKCLHCHELEHYSTKCPHKKARNKTSGGVVGEALA